VPNAIISVSPGLAKQCDTNGMKVIEIWDLPALLNCLVTICEQAENVIFVRTGHAIYRII
jgi:hypothetical protein